jgi:hypothetical protein
MNHKYSAPLLMGLIWLVGCTGTETNEPAPVEPSQPVSDTGLGIPAELVTDGLKLMGHPFDKKITYKVTGFPVGSSSEQVVVPSYDADKKQITFNYEGSPSMSSETYELKADGVYGVSLAGNALEPPLKALPSNVSEGMSWPSVGTLKQGAGIDINTTIRVIGREQVKVPAGDYDALVIAEQGTINTEGGTLKVTGRAWYVEGVGAVKRLVDQTDPTGKASNITIEALKVQ